jgi:hypothetical protein
MNYSQIQPSSSILVFSADKKITHSLATRTRNLLGNLYIVFVLIEFGVNLFGGKSIFSRSDSAYIPLLFSFIYIISRGFHSRAFKITLDLENQIIEINYFFFYNHRYQSKFKDTQLKCRINKNNKFY